MRVENKKVSKWASNSRGTTKKNERGAGKCGVKGLVGVGGVTYFLLDVCRVFVLFEIG